MNTLIKSRRNFISNLGISAAVLTLVSVPEIVSCIDPETNLETMWKRFVRLNEGRRNFIDSQIDERLLPVMCKGHFPRLGNQILFSENILAQPILIYWGSQRKAANDMMITFFNKNDQSKIATINKYELEVLFELSKAVGKINLLSILSKPGSTENQTMSKREIAIVYVTANNKITIESKINNQFV